MSRDPLTLEILKSLSFRKTMHLSGGSKWSELTQENKKYGLFVWCRTDGSPEYNYTARSLSTTDGLLAVDLLADDCDVKLERFFKEYNKKKPGVIVKEKQT